MTTQQSAFGVKVLTIATLGLLLCATSSIQARTATGASEANNAARTISSAHFAEPLVRTSPTTATEDAALAEAIETHQQGTSGNFRALTVFLSKYPRSGWAAALHANMGLSYLHDGYFSQAIGAWRAAWSEGRGAKDPRSKATVDRAVGELIHLYTSLGQFDQVSELFDEIGNRPISGSATEAVQEAREELELVTKDPRHLFNCGPVGLRELISALHPEDRAGNLLLAYRAGPNGTSLAELGGLAKKAKFSYRLVFRKPDQPIPVPALAHWKLGHYSAIVGKTNGRYHLKDLAISGSDLWVTRDALNAEASGYFLVPSSLPTTGLREVAATEASHVWGKGPTNGTQPGDPGDNGAHNGPNNQPGGPPNHPPNNCPMCGYDIKEATVGVTLSDLPVGYHPPIGPAPSVRITYNQREDSQPANFSFFNVGQKWTLNWLTYVTDDPSNPGANVSRYLSGGGAYYYTGYSSATGRFASQNTDGSVLVRTSQSPIIYQRQLGDGSIEVYSQSDGSASFPRKVFLTQLIDPQGNAITLSYDSQLRLTALTDATGRQTTFSYGVASFPLAITKITDPFGRAAALTYDASGRLSSITDILGLTSSFVYDANSLVNAMTTPYGTTSFSYTTPGAAGPPRFVQVTDPMGYHEREEWLEPAPIPDSDPAASVPQGMPTTLTNQYLSYRDSFYWDRNAYIVASCTPTGGCDYTKARQTHFAHVPGTSTKSTSVESVKYPLENRIWYAYSGQTSSLNAGNFEQTTAAGRVLDDGTTQLSQFSYDTGGFYKLTQAVDPLGRTTSFSYANQIDLAAIAQTTAYGIRTIIGQFAYNTHHRPILATDASGKTSVFSYNAAGQLTSVTNPLNQKTTFVYNSSGDLTSVVNANNITAGTYTYDAFDRVATYTDSQGWMISYNYDAANRLTKVTYPDGTSQSYTYNKLDLASYQDRLGRIWSYAHDANRRLTIITDPAGRETQLAYSPIGKVAAQTDPNGHTTNWAYDIEGRLITKTYADNSNATYSYETTTSRVKSATDALGQIKQFSYAKDDHLLGITYTSAVHPTPNVSYSYDPYFPRITSRTDGAGTTQYGYVPAGSLGALQIQQETLPSGGIAITSSYDELGRAASLSITGSGTETFQYDALGRIATHGNDLGSFTMAYLGQTSQITSRQLASSTLATSWSYLTNADDRRLASVGTVGLSAGQSSTFQYSSNSEGFVTGGTQTSDATISYPPNSLAQTISFNNLNQATSVSGQALTWDANGNLLSDGTRTYSWDAENRLIGISYPGQPGKATAFSYDGLGRRITISSTPAGGGSTVVTSYIWCGASLCQARAATSAVNRSYYAEGEFVPGSPSQANYYGPDRTGSTRRVFTPSSAPTYDYDAYGNPLQATAPLTDFGYSGTFYNADSGLYLTSYRPYDPVAGRFLSRDPIGEGGDPYGNLYAYVGGNPVSGSDPAGLFYFDAAAMARAAARAGTVEVAGGGPLDVLADVAAAALLGYGIYDALTPPSSPTASASAGGGGDKGGGPAEPGAPAAPCPSGGGGGAGGSSPGGGYPPGGGGGEGGAGAGGGNGGGTLTPGESAEIQEISNNFDTTIDVVGSRAAGEGRNINTDFPVGKGPGTRSDIDFRIDASHPEVNNLINALKAVGNNAGRAAARFSTGIRPTKPPFIRFTPGQ